MKINSVVSFRGEIYTDSYGNSNAAEDSLDNDDQKVSLVSIFVGPKECEMVSGFFQFQAFSRVFKNFHELFHKQFGKITKDSLDNDDQKVSLVSIFVGPKECEMVSEFFQFQVFSQVFRSLHEFS